jgi:hypothetical protein
MITFKKFPKETGLRAVGSGPRHSHIKLNGEEIGSICPLGGGWRAPLAGWYFVLHGAGFEYTNTCGSPRETEDQAKADAKTLIRSLLGEKA